MKVLFYMLIVDISIKIADVAIKVGKYYQNKIKQVRGI